LKADTTIIVYSYSSEIKLRLQYRNAVLRTIQLQQYILWSSISYTIHLIIGANFQTGRPFLFTKFKMNVQQVPQCKQRRVTYLLTYIMSEIRHG
jgi:hypothetical protein